jgi:hypothetical protein
MARFGSRIVNGTACVATNEVTLVISHWFWPGSARPSSRRFTPTPFPNHKYSTSRACRRTALYHPKLLREFIFPYEAVRAAASPDAVIAAFVDSTYSHAAMLAGWDRAALERPVLAIRR